MKPDSETESLRGERVSVEHEGGLIERGQLFTMFATPILRLRHPHHDRLNLGLLSAINSLRRMGPGQERSNRNGWHSDFDFLQSELPTVQELRSFIVESVVAAERALARRDIANEASIALQGWANINPTGGYNAPHRHPGYAWSGTYYVQQPHAEGQSGMIEFIDPRTDVTNWSGLCPREGIWSTSKFRVRPKAGEMILFPSFLLHWVYPNVSMEDRMSIAFNARFGD